MNQTYRPKFYNQTSHSHIPKNDVISCSVFTLNFLIKVGALPFFQIPASVLLSLMKLWIILFLMSHLLLLLWNGGCSVNNYSFTTNGTNCKSKRWSSALILEELYWVIPCPSFLQFVLFLYMRKFKEDPYQKLNWAATILITIKRVRAY